MFISKQVTVQTKEFASHFLDINFFKKSIFAYYQHIYKKEKNKNIFYRCVFFSLCFLFMGLGALILLKSPNFISGFYFRNHAGTMKGVMNMLCFFCAGIAFFSGYYIHPEKEAMQYLIGKVEREFKSPEKSLQMEFNHIFANLPEEMFSSKKLIRIKELL
jgi:hypothetical protein